MYSVDISNVKIIQIPESNLKDDLERLMLSYSFQMLDYEFEEKFKYELSLIEDRHEIKLPYTVNEEKTEINIIIPKELMNDGYDKRITLSKKLKKVKNA